MAASINQFAKIAIVGDEHTVVLEGTLQYLIVARARRDFGDGNYIVTPLTQSQNYSMAQLSSATKVMFQDLCACG